MLSKEHQLPAPLTSSVHLSLESHPNQRHNFPWTKIKSEASLRAALTNNDTEQMRSLALRSAQDPHFEHIVASLLYESAIQKNVPACAAVLKYIAPHASPMLSFWMTMASEDAPMLAWVGQHDELARYIFLPMPCPNRDWCLEHKANRDDPGPQFRTWWRQFKEPLRQAVADHLRVEWQRRFTAQPKLYHLLDTPSREQAVFVATRPEAIWDMPVLAKHYPDIQEIYTVTHTLYDGIAARQQMMAYFSKNNCPIETYDLPL